MSDYDTILAEHNKSLQLMLTHLERIKEVRNTIQPLQDGAIVIGRNQGFDENIQQILEYLSSINSIVPSEKYSLYENQYIRLKKKRYESKAILNIYTLYIKEINKLKYVNFSMLQQKIVDEEHKSILDNIIRINWSDAFSNSLCKNETQRDKFNQIYSTHSICFN